MKSPLTISMYHYVRDLKASKYPEIKGLDTSLFEQQLLYFKKHYTFVDADDLIDSIKNKSPLPKNALLLTFDDAYIDHYDNAYPLMKQHGVKGCFFPPAEAISQNVVLIVNKIHFLLASVPDKTKLITAINKHVDERREEFNIESSEEYWNQRPPADNQDPEEIIYIKRMLQVILPDELRTDITNALFSEFVTEDEASFAQELYMSPEQLAELSDNGMYIGGHGYKHDWLGRSDYETQKKEIAQTMDFLRSVNSRTEDWIMCYPYGSYNDDTLKILSENNCAVGLTTNFNIADIATENPLTLSRLDTNHLPKDENAEPNEWTRQVLETV